MSPIHYLPTREAAQHLGLSPRTLEKYRTSGVGPAYRKLGGAVRYTLADLDAWAELGLRRSTSTPAEDGSALRRTEG